MKRIISLCQIKYQAGSSKATRSGEKNPEVLEKHGRTVFVRVALPV